MSNSSNSLLSLNPVESKLSVKFYSILFLFMIWTFTQILIPIKFLPYEILIKVEFYKSAIPIFLATISLILYIKNLRLYTYLLPFIFFILFVIISSLIKFAFYTYSEVIFYDIFKYILWIVGMLIVFPKIFDSMYKIKLLLKYNVVLIFYFLTLSTIFLLYTGVDPVLFVSEERMELLYGNPLYFGGILYTLLCSSSLLLWLTPSKYEKFYLTLFIIISLYLIFLTNARTFILASIIFFSLYFYFSNKNFKLFFWLLIFPFFIGLSIYFSYLDFNDLSSNRLSIWKDALSNGVKFPNIFIGNFDLGYTKELTLDSGEVVEQSFQRYAVDNTYIELFINTGVIGLILFILGLKNLLSIKRMNINFINNESKKGKNIFIIAYSVLISLFFSAIFYGHYPSFGNTLNSVLFPAIVSVLILTKRLKNKI